jgi:hypothetical protein
MRKISALEGGGDISLDMYVCESLHFPYVQCTMYTVQCTMYITMYMHSRGGGGWDVPFLHTKHVYGYQLLLS